MTGRIVGGDSGRGTAGQPPLDTGLEHGEARLDGFYVRRGKRWLDLAISIPGLLMAAVPMAFIGLVILLFDGRPVVFKQGRIGRFGDRFRLLKFRTMGANADAQNSVTVSGDERVTRLGGWLRRWKLDELPQLLNVVRGDMSLVGPRPDVPGYWDRLVGRDRDLLALRPGVTGPGTLVFKREEEIFAAADDPIEMNDKFVFPLKIKFAHRYAKEISLTSDLKWIVYTLLPESKLNLRLASQDWIIPSATERLENTDVMESEDGIPGDDPHTWSERS